MPVNVLDHHNRIINQDADRKYQREQTDPVQREAPGPRGEQRGRQRQHHGNADNGRLAHAECKKHQNHHRGGGKNQLLNQLHRLVIGGFAVVARHADLHATRYDGVVQFGDPLRDFFGHLHRVFPWLFGDGNRDGRKLAAHGGRWRRGGLAHAEPDVL